MNMTFQTVAVKNKQIVFIIQKKKKVQSSSVAEESTAESVQWSNTDIEFPSTSTSDEIEIISQTDDEAICKLLSALPIPSEGLSSPTVDKDEVEPNPTDLQPSSVTQEDLKENEPGNTYLFYYVQKLYKFSLF